MKQSPDRMPVILPISQLRKLGGLAKRRGTRSLNPIAQEFFNWGFQTFCEEVKHSIRYMTGLRESDRILEVISKGPGKLDCIDGRRHKHIFYFASTYIYNLQCIASGIPKTSLFILVMWFFRLKLDQFCKAISGKSQ